MKKSRIFRSSNESNTGQGMTEFALVFPILLLLTLGIVEFGRMLFIYSAVASASREAVRYGSAAGETPDGTPRYMDCTGMQEAAMRVGSIAGIQGSDIVMQYDHGPSTSVFDTCPATSADDISGGVDRIIVQVSTTYESIVPLVNIPGFTINSQSARTVVKDIQVGVEVDDDEDDDEETEATVSFTLSGQTVPENVGTATVIAQLSETSASDVTVPFTVGGSAAGGAGNDYTITSSPVTISAGDTTANIVITVNDDAVMESDETVVVTMGTPSNAAKGSPDEHTLTITDNDSAAPTVYFGSASQSGPEKVGSMTIAVQLSAMSGDDVTVPFSVSGSASEGAGNDFTITSSPVTISAGDTSASISIVVNDDGLVEGNETVVVTMGTPTNADKGSPDVHTATITDNDSLPIVSFALSSQSNDESISSWLIRIEMDRTSLSDVSVPFTLGGSASEGADYSITASPVTISAGSDWTNITVTVVNDSNVEGDEQVVATMGTPTNATKGSPNVHTATIEDDDSALPTPSAPVFDAVNWTKSGNKCQSISFTWTPNSDWSSNPGSNPVQYQVYKNGSSQGTQTPSDPNPTTWNTGVNLNNNASVTLESQALFLGGVGSEVLSKTFKCNKGNLVEQ